VYGHEPGALDDDERPEAARFISSHASYNYRRSRTTTCASTGKHAFSSALAATAQAGGEKFLTQ
jgi:hypothetical protein